ncbi:outer membrane beta-barrel protein [Ancylomarina longa]|uniref:Outer membrane protein beta-barrel domain-containing protein n=1 Tax=Ancylomarina longa TaxID=2487017 RepID=A0A434ATZ2_9BACT|nr:outer membrane beta-barrel protein [Ancylomarina longa]RUT77879.1 hypothetical protein DLK05_11105 [Ancylomarina longa]
MKKLAFIIILYSFLNPEIASSQMKKGDMLIGVSSTLNTLGTGSNLMNLSFSSVKYKSNAEGYRESDADKLTNYNLQPKVGYFITNKIALGLDLNLSIFKNKDGSSSDEVTQSSFSIGPLFRYYIPSEKVMPFFELSTAFGSMTNKYQSVNLNDKSTSRITSLGGGFGIAAPLGKKVTFDVLAEYSSLTIKDKDNNPDDEKTVIGTFGINFGFTIILGAK